MVRIVRYDDHTLKCLVLSKSFPLGLCSGICYTMSVLCSAFQMTGGHSKLWIICIAEQELLALQMQYFFLFIYHLPFMLLLHILDISWIHFKKSIFFCSNSGCTIIKRHEINEVDGKKVYFFLLWHVSTSVCRSL